MRVCCKFKNKRGVTSLLAIWALIVVGAMLGVFAQMVNNSVTRTYRAHADAVNFNAIASVRAVMAEDGSFPDESEIGFEGQAFKDVRVKVCEDDEGMELQSQCSVNGHLRTLTVGFDDGPDKPAIANSDYSDYLQGKVGWEFCR